MEVGLRTAEMGRPSHIAASGSELSGNQLGEFLFRLVVAASSVVSIY